MASRALPAGSALAEAFGIDGHTVYLNHGSFGACPKAVLDAQDVLRARMESDAVRFMVDDLWGLIDRSRAALAPVVGCEARDLVFVANATTGVTTVLDNLDLGPGDEILTTDCEYTACSNNLDRMAARMGATVVRARLPWPVDSEQGVIDAVMSKVTTRTRVVMLSLITSATAIRMPIEALVEQLHAKGIEVLLDAAHGPGCVPMDLRALGVAWATGNAHKWLCAPKGSAMLYVREDLQQGFRPMVLSNDAGRLAEAAAANGRSGFNHEFDYQGTDDPTASMCVADSVGWLSRVLPGGIDAVMTHNRDLCLEGLGLVCERLGLAPAVPESMTGPIGTVVLPDGAPEAATLKAALLDRWRIQIPVWGTPGGTTSVRLSAQVYNTRDQYAYLADALSALLGGG